MAENRFFQVAVTLAFLAVLVHSATALNSTGVQLWLPFSSDALNHNVTPTWTQVNSTGNFSFIPNCLNSAGCINETQTVFQFNYTPGLYPSNNFSVSMFVDPQSTVGDQTLFLKGSRGSNFIQLYYSNGFLYANSDTSGGPQKITGMPVNAWNYWTLSCNEDGQGTGLIYENAALAGSVGGLCNDTTTNGELRLFDDSFNYTPSSVQAQAFSYFNRSLNPGEITSLYNAQGVPQFDLYAPQLAGLNLSPVPPYTTSEQVTVGLTFAMPDGAKGNLLSYSIMNNFQGYDVNVSSGVFPANTKTYAYTLQMTLPSIATEYGYGVYATSTDGLVNYTGFVPIFINASALNLTYSNAVASNFTPCSYSNVTVQWSDSVNNLQYYYCTVSEANGTQYTEVHTFPNAGLNEPSVCTVQLSCSNDSYTGVVIGANDSQGNWNQTSYAIHSFNYVPVSTTAVAITTIPASTTSTTSSSTTTVTGRWIVQPTVKPDVIPNYAATPATATQTKPTWGWQVSLTLVAGAIVLSIAGFLYYTRKIV